MRLERWAPTATNAASNPPLLHRRLDVVDPMVEGDGHAEISDTIDLGIEHVARHAVGGNAEMDHAAGERACIPDFDPMAQPCQMIGRRKPGRAGADDQDAFAARFGLARKTPPLLQGEIAEIALDRVDADRAVQVLAVAAVLAGVIADTAVHRRQRIVHRQNAPGFLVTICLHLGKPGLNILAGGAGMVAGWQEIDIDWPTDAERTRAFFLAEIRLDGQIARLSTHRPSLHEFALLRLGSPSQVQRLLPMIARSTLIKINCLSTIGEGGVN